MPRFTQLQTRRLDAGAVTITADELVRRNAAFAARRASAGLPFPTPHTLRVLGCVDPRVDPAHVLGLDLGEAVVMRNIGGRVTPAVLRSWALLAKLGQSNPDDAPNAGPPHLTILHHTDCGIKKLAALPEQLAEFFEIPVADLNTKEINDPHAAVRVDVEIARRTLPSLVISGLVYDTETGLSRLSFRPAPHNVRSFRAYGLPDAARYLPRTPGSPSQHLGSRVGEAKPIPVRPGARTAYACRQGRPRPTDR